MAAILTLDTASRKEQKCPAERDRGLWYPALMDFWEMAEQWGAVTVPAMLKATDGPAYRSPSAAMAIARDGCFAGAITSCCTKADLILRMGEVRRGQVQNLRCGQRSTPFDLHLSRRSAAQIHPFPLFDPELSAKLPDSRNCGNRLTKSVGSRASTRLIPASRDPKSLTNLVLAKSVGLHGRIAAEALA